MIKKILTLLLLFCTTANLYAIETVTYFYNNALGSPVAAADENGSVLWREIYKPYGDRINHTGDATNDVWYTGKPQDNDTGLSYMGARWYDPQVGRFMAMDPVDVQIDNVQSFNRYAYANNNPYAFTDPNGEEPLDVVKGIINEFADFYVASVPITTVYTTAASFAGVDIIPNISYVDAADGNAGEWAFIGGTTLAGGRGLIRAVPKFFSKGGKQIAKEIPISRAKYGEAADHIADAQKAGHPDVLEIARDGASANRNASIGGLPKVPGKQLDEYPPAMFKEGGTGASVRAISPSDNMAAGACIGNACRGIADGEKVRIKVVP